ncbi:winged helix-turn-helix transcriptional regulator [Brevifollis gellanilyticus]|uniref:Transcriptional regulator n=1 Tax=Brevifollis gellanilyticus TaxID=748831 RepID=A0A512MBQ3_9BACT|nr:helix-turn-helix domain-containing protein [Brevifollis gellanilyticus]GEP44153.1 transcriptional regulator [Brevifollis gellanilyticus]
MITAAYPYKADPLRDDCPLNAAIHVIRGRWKACILHELLAGPRRFTELRTSFPGVATQALSMQLRQLEADGVILRTVHEGRPARVEYRIAPDGEALLGILDSLRSWGEGYLQRQTAARLREEAVPV